MKKIILARTLALTVGLFIIGCGSDAPENVAENFALSLSKADMEKVVLLSSDRMKDDLDRILFACSDEVIRKAEKETKLYMLEIEKAKSDLADSGDKIHNQNHWMSEELREKVKEFRKKKEIVWTSEYGSLDKVPEDVVNQSIEELHALAQTKTKERVILMINTLGVKENNLAIEIVSDGIANDITRLYKPYKVYDAAKSVIMKNPPKITPECINKTTSYGDINNINLLEVSNPSPDRAEVRLELIDKENKSSKVKVGVEKINKIWKVTYM